jgi:hypothetical protein
MPVLDWIAETLLAIAKAVPVWLVEKDSPNFLLVRGMLGLLLIVLIVYVLTMRPIRSALARLWNRIFNLAKGKG